MSEPNENVHSENVYIRSEKQWAWEEKQFPESGLLDEKDMCKQKRKSLQATHISFDRIDVWK